MADEDSRDSTNITDDNFQAAVDFDHIIGSDGDGDSDDDLAEVRDKKNGAKDMLKYSIIDKGESVATAGLPIKREKVNGKVVVEGLTSDGANDGTVTKIENRHIVVRKQQVRVPMRKTLEQGDAVGNCHGVVDLDLPNSVSAIVEIDEKTPNNNVVMLMDVFSCVACHEVFLSQDDLNDHILTHKDDAFLCSFCGRSFINAKAQKLHENVCGKTSKVFPPETCGLFQCKDCRRFFSTKTDLKKHRLSHIPESYACTICDKGFTHERDLLRHTFTHSKLKPFKCEEPGCGKGFTCNSSLNKHIQLKHQGDGKSYRCQTCGKTFQVESDIKRHVYTHTDVRPYKCSQCPKSYTCKSSLRQHVALIHEAKKLPCSLCSKSFSLKQDLERHMHTHRGTKPWQCQICKRRYSAKNALAVHKRNAHEIFSVLDEEKKEFPEWTESKVKEDSTEENTEEEIILEVDMKSVADKNIGTDESSVDEIFHVLDEATTELTDTIEVIIEPTGKETEDNGMILGEESELVIDKPEFTIIENC